MTAAERGFTLLEVLVAFAIVSVTLVAAYQSFWTGLTVLHRTQDRLTATQLAQSLIDRVGQDIPLAIGVEIGRFDAGPRWEITVTGGEAIAETRPVLVVEAAVALADGDPAQGVVLTTRRIGGAP